MITHSPHSRQTSQAINLAISLPLTLTIWSTRAPYDVACGGMRRRMRWRQGVGVPPE